MAERETNGIVEGETKRFVNFFTTLAPVEEVLLEIVAKGEQSTTGCVTRGVDAVRASDTLG